MINSSQNFAIYRRNRQCLLFGENLEMLGKKNNPKTDEATLLQPEATIQDDDENLRVITNVIGYTGSDKLTIMAKHVDSIKSISDLEDFFQYLFKISWRCNEISGPDKFFLRNQLNERDWDLLDFLCQGLVDENLALMLRTQIESLKTELSKLKPNLLAMAEKLKTKEKTETPTKKKSSKKTNISNLPILDTLIGCWLDIKYIDTILQCLTVLRNDTQLSNRFFRIAILRVIEIIGEYAKKFSADTILVLPPDDWKKLMELRNQIEHIRRGSWLTQEVELLLEIDNKLLNDFFTKDLDIVYLQLRAVKAGLEVLAQKKLSEPNKNLKLSDFVQKDAIFKTKLENTAEILKQVFDKQNKLSPADQRNLLTKTFNREQLVLYQAIFPKRIDIDFKVLANNKNFEDVKQEWLKTTDPDKRCLLIYCQENNTWHFVGKNTQQEIIDQLPPLVKDALPRIKDTEQQVIKKITERFENAKGIQGTLLANAAKSLGYDLNEHHLFSMLGLNEREYVQLVADRKELEVIQQQLKSIGKSNQATKEDLINKIKPLNANLKDWNDWFDLLRQRTSYLQGTLNEEEYAQKVSGIMQTKLSDRQKHFKQILNHELPIAKFEDFDDLVKNLVLNDSISNEIICEVDGKLNLDEEASKLDTNRKEKTELYHVIKEVKIWFNDLITLGNLASYYLKQNNNDPERLQLLFGTNSFYYLAAQKLLEIINETSERLMERQIYNQHFAHSENISASRLLLFKRFRGGIAHRPMAIDRDQVVWFFYHWVVDAHVDLHQVHQKVQQTTTATSKNEIDDSTVGIEYHTRTKLTSTQFTKHLGAILAYCKIISTHENIQLIGGLLGSDIGIQSNLNLLLKNDSKELSPLELLNIQWKLTQLLGLTVSVITLNTLSNQVKNNFLLQDHLNLIVANSLNLFEFNYRISLINDYRNQSLFEINLTNGTRIRRGSPEFSIENIEKASSAIYLTTQKEREMIVNKRQEELSQYEEILKEKALILTNALIKKIGILSMPKRTALCKLFQLEKEIDQLVDKYFIAHKNEILTNRNTYIYTIFNYRKEVKALNLETIKDDTLANNLKKLIKKRDKMFNDLADLFNGGNIYHQQGQCSVNFENIPYNFDESFENVAWLMRAYNEFRTLQLTIIPKDAFKPIRHTVAVSKNFIRSLTISNDRNRFSIWQKKVVMASEIYFNVGLLIDEVSSSKVLQLLEQNIINSEQISDQIFEDFKQRFIEPEEYIMNIENRDKRFFAYKYPLYLEVKKHHLSLPKEDDVYAINEAIVSKIVHTVDQFSRYIDECKKQHQSIKKMIFAEDKKPPITIESLITLKGNYNKVQSIEVVRKFLFPTAIKNLNDLLKQYDVLEQNRFYPNNYQEDDALLTNMIEFKNKLSLLEHLYTRMFYLKHEREQKESILGQSDPASIAALLILEQLKELRLEIDILTNIIESTKIEMQNTDHFKNIIASKFTPDELWQQIVDNINMCEKKSNKLPTGSKKQKSSTRSKAAHFGRSYDADGSDNTGFFKHRNQSRPKKNITNQQRLLSLIGEDDSSVKDLSENLHITREEIAFSVADENRYYTADLINLLLCSIGKEEDNTIQIYPAINIDNIDEIIDKIQKQEKAFAFVPLFVAYDPKDLNHKNHWVALIVDKENQLIFYLDPAQKTNSNQIGSKEFFESPKSPIVNPINFQEAEQDEGWVRHCGAYVVEIFLQFAKTIKKGQCISAFLLPDVNLPDSISLETALSSIPCGEAEDIVNIRKQHIQMAINILFEINNYQQIDEDRMTDTMVVPLFGS